MSNEVATQEEKVPQKTKGRREEEEAQETLWESLRTLRSDVKRLNQAIDFNEDNPRKLTILVNARAKMLQQIFYCVSLIRNPKLRLTNDSGRARDFARLIQKALLEDNPAAAKLVEEASQTQNAAGRNDGGDSSSQKEENEASPKNKVDSKEEKEDE